MGVTPAHLEGFLLVFMRVGAMLLAAPWFGSRTIPPQLKVGLTAVVSLLLLPVVDVREMTPPQGIAPWIVTVGGEVVLGTTVGLMIRFLFIAVSMAGQLMDLEVGLNLAGFFNPEFDSHTSALQNLADLVALLVFLGMDAHHLLLRGLAHSFQVLPPRGWDFSGASVEAMVRFSAELWRIALRVGAPLVAAQFLVKVVLALLARAAPQMNVFMVGFPLQIAVGLLTLAYMLPVVAAVLDELFGELGGQIMGLLQLLKR